MDIITNFEKELEKYGLTISTYEQICKDIDAKLNGEVDCDWSELKEKYNVQCNPDTIRKSSSTIFGGKFRTDYFKRKIEKEQNGYSRDSELDERLRELERLKIKYRDYKRSWNKQNYENTRFDEVMELLEERLDNFSRTNFSVPENIPVSFENDSMIVCLSDLHIGQTFSSTFGEYNSEIAKHRLEKYLNEIITIGGLHNVNRVFVVMLGDGISGNLHKTLEISNKENVIDQLKLSIEYITSFCYELTKHFNVYFASSSGNHSRLQAKDLAQHSERLDAFIAWDVCRVLSENNNFYSLLHRNIDDGIADLNIDGKYYLCVHGDFDETTKNGYMKLSAMCGFFPEYILCGHKHFCMMNQETKFIQSGSLASCGDDYTVEKRLTGKASQMVCIVNNDGVKACYPVILS